MSVPLIAPAVFETGAACAAFAFADNVGHDHAVVVYRLYASLVGRPDGHVLEVEVEVVGFCEWVQVDRVEAEEVVGDEAARRTHGFGMLCH
eukprot:CAMPEP_0184700404 /NCGR_PEP_ID=MMETSP0313-20130426/13015_1 /TAXON_ID=2792 /ORGANISM="Porphyridium aerugineum, Strain SAG 1380-2" /LENGTH=90 /DNA_ID=CAMNT_0027160055 /DNA_START=316 /DNA_END=588 /DNA_ORIENTATION=-